MLAKPEINNPKSLMLLTLKWGTLPGVAGGLVAGLLLAATSILLFHSNNYSDGWTILASAVGVGIGISIQSYSAFRNLLDANYHEWSAVDLAEDVELPLPYHVAFSRAVDGIATLPNAWVLAADSTTGRVEAALGPSLRSRGWRITIGMGADRPDVTHVRVMAQSPLATGILGRGANRRAVARVSSLLRVA